MQESKQKTNTKEKGLFTVLFDLFRSIKLTIFLLILLAILSIIGTVILQNATSGEYIQRYGVRLYAVLNFFNLFDMYHSWWFSTILLLLVVNLVACSLDRFPGVWNQFFRKGSSGELGDKMLKTLPYVEKIRVPGLAETREGLLQSSLKKSFGSPGRIETESTITLFSEKGRFSRLGVYVTHLSILIILVGGLMGSLFGFKGFVNILEGEMVDQVFLRARDRDATRAIGFSVRCDDFNITFYDLPGKQEKHVKEYSSALTVLENGQEVLKKTIKVNHPLFHKGLAFYQSSYGAIHDVTLGVQFRGQKEKTFFKIMEGGTAPVPNTSAFIRFIKYQHQLHTYGEGAQFALFKQNQQPRVFWLLKNVPQFDEKRGDELIFSMDEVIEKEYTGLQVTKDPGVWVVWVGCTLMILGLIISFFFSHQRVWIRISKGREDEVVLAGTASKNRVGFEKTFKDLAGRIRSAGNQ